MNLICVGISHHTAPLDVRERLWFSDDEIRNTLPLLKPLGASESVMFSTCNRTELYVLTDDSDLKFDNLKRFLITQKSAEKHIQLSDMFSLTAGDAARHLYRVAAGIDSMILGDVQILAQVKDGFNLASELNTVGIFMNRLFQLAFRVGKRARAETRICEGPASVSYAAVELAERIFEDLRKKTAFIIGAGEMADLTATHLRSKEIGKLLITNRTQERAQQLAKKLQGTAIPFDIWRDALAESDIIISSIEIDRFILQPDDITSLNRKHGHGPLFVIDLGVPRNINPSIKELEQVFLYDLDMLNTMVNKNIQQRKTEIPKVEAIIHDVLQELTQWYSSLDVNPTITALTQFMEDIREEELAKNINRLEPKDRELVELITKRIINKIIHAPIINLRNGEGLSLTERLQNIDALQKLFGLAKPSKRGPDAK
jgi:glutamyl-tRNA reductase